MDKLESTAEAAELSEKLNAVIEKLINKEGILIVDNDNVNKEERVLSLNINYDAPMFG